MIRAILLTIVFGIGLVYSVREVFREWRFMKDSVGKIHFSYKGKYYLLWSVIYIYLIYLQYV